MEQKKTKPTQQTAQVPQLDIKEVSPDTALAQAAIAPAAVTGATREETMVKARAVMAERNPRNFHKVRESILETCRRPRFAEKALYKYPRGASIIRGPSVKLARAMAQAWGHIQTGFAVLERTDEWCHLRGGAVDLQTNADSITEDRFKVLIQRKFQDPQTKTTVTKWIVPDERDFRELQNRHGAFLERNGIIKLMPFDLVDEAQEVIEETLRNIARQNPAQTKTQLIDSFGKMGITIAMIERIIGHSIDMLTPEEMAELQGIYNSVVDGHTTIEEHLKRTEPVDDLKEPKAAAPAASAPVATLSEQQISNLTDLMNEHKIGAKQFGEWLKTQGIQDPDAIPASLYDGIVAWIKSHQTPGSNLFGGKK